MRLCPLPPPCHGEACQNSPAYPVATVEGWPPRPPLASAHGRGSAAATGGGDTARPTPFLCYMGGAAASNAAQHGLLLRRHAQPTGGGRAGPIPLLSGRGGRGGHSVPPTRWPRRTVATEAEVAAAEERGVGTSVDDGPGAKGDVSGSGGGFRHCANLHSLGGDGPRRPQEYNYNLFTFMS